MKITRAPGLGKRPDLWNPLAPVAWVDEKGGILDYDGSTLGGRATYLQEPFEQGDARRLPPELWVASAAHLEQVQTGELTLDRLTPDHQTLLRLVFTRLLVAHALLVRAEATELTAVTEHDWRMSGREPDLNWWLVDALRSAAPLEVGVDFSIDGAIHTDRHDPAASLSWPDIQHPS